MTRPGSSSNDRDVRPRFDLLPAIDVRTGRVVRLEQGDFDREQVYGSDVLATARAFHEAGARWVHLVDLDGARNGVRRLDPALLRGLVGETSDALPGDGRFNVEIGGGLRTVDDIRVVLEAGCARAVLGTAAVADATLVRSAVAEFGADRIAVAIDVRDGRAVGEGWRSGAPGVGVDVLLTTLSTIGVRTLIVTSIDRDGLLDGPDLALLESIVAATDADVFASGGIRSVGDLDAVRAIGCSGAIVGRALYDGELDLRAALDHVGRGLPAGG